MARDLTPEQNERLRPIAKALLASHPYSGNGTHLASDLGVSQSTVSKLIGGTQGAGRALAERICGLAGRHIEEVVGGHATITLEDIDRRLGHIERLLVQLVADRQPATGNPDNLDESATRKKHR